MARKSSSGEWLLILLVVGAFVIVQVMAFIKDHLDFFLVIGIIGGGLWLISRNKASSNRHQTTTNTVASKSSPQTTTYSKKVVNSDLVWKRQGEAVQVNGISINGGLLYVGSDLSAAQRYARHEAALINPSYKIGNIATADCHTRLLSYWPSYAEASPEARAAYLHWLSQGKSDPEADIGYVFLYFYGLERRSLFDIRTSEIARKDLPAIREEISRLLGIYGSNNSFRSYATSLLDFISDDLNEFDLPPEIQSRSWTLPFSYKVKLGWFAVNGQPVPADWAYGWLMMEPSIRLRTPALRCPTEFKRLFLERYRHVYGEGIKLIVNKTRLKLTHRPASPSLAASGGYEKTTELPDISVMTGPVKKLQELVDHCLECLDGYSRVLGRSPDKAGSMDAILELPLALWPEENRQPLLRVKETIEKAGIPATIKFSKMRSWLPAWSDISRSRLTSFASRLAEIDLAIEPDPRFGGPIPGDDATVVIFVDDGSLTTPSPRYSAAALTLQLAVAVSSADGGTNEAEKAMLMHQLEGWLHLDEAERRRLRAHLRWLLTEEPGLNGIKKRVEALPTSAREILGDFLAEVAHADNEVSAAEVRVLERIYKTLDLDMKTLYSKLHITASEPVTVRIPQAGKSGFAVPDRPKAAEPGLKLDMAKVASLHAESEKVSAILGAIFTETAPPEVMVGIDDGLSSHDVANDGIWGLDAAHSALVRILCGRTAWAKVELVELAEDRTLMIDGALELINEAAFDQFDMPFSEGDDPVEINQDVVKEILK